MKQRELGRFLRLLRERTAPQTSDRRKRRTPGLRREELAALLGVSPTWYTWIEQGRAPSVSHEVLSRLARALHMTDEERRYAWEAAGLGPVRASLVTEKVPPAVLDVLTALASPAYCLGRYWDAVGWNKAAEDLFPDWLGPDREERNLLAFVFCEPAARTFIVDWELRARRLVAEFAGDAADVAGEQTYQALVARLCAASGDFRVLWSRQEISFREPARKSFRHPNRGLLFYEQTTFAPLSQRDLKLVVLSPKGS